MLNDIIICIVLLTICSEGSVDRVTKLVLQQEYKGLESRGNTPTTKGPGKSWKTNWDVLYEPCDIFLMKFFLVTVSFTMNHLCIIFMIWF